MEGGGGLDGLASELIRPGLIAPQIASAHVQVTRARSIRLVRLAKKAAGTPAFGSFSFVVHPGIQARAEL